MIVTNRDKPNKLEKGLWCTNLLNVEKIFNGLDTLYQEKEYALFQIDDFIIDKERFATDIVSTQDVLDPLELLANTLIKKA